MNVPATARPSRTTEPHGRQPALRVVSPSSTSASAPEVAWSLLQRLGLARSPAADGPVQTGFIIGTGRCGTTLLAQMLNAHPRICVPHELQILFEEQTGNGPRLWEAFERGDHLRWSARDFSAAIRRWCPYRLHRWFSYEGFLRRQTYPIVDPGRLVGDLYAAIARSVGKDTFLEQTPWYGQRLDIVVRSCAWLDGDAFLGREFACENRRRLLCAQLARRGTSLAHPESAARRAGHRRPSRLGSAGRRARHHARHERRAGSVRRGRAGCAG